MINVSFNTAKPAASLHVDKEAEIKKVDPWPLEQRLPQPKHDLFDYKIKYRFARSKESAITHPYEYYRSRPYGYYTRVLACSDVSKEGMLLWLIWQIA